MKEELGKIGKNNWKESGYYYSILKLIKKL